VRAEALNALAQIDPPEARPTLKKVLARRDECSVQLRRRAVYILGRNGTEESAADLLVVARTDPDASVRGDAINMIGRMPGTATVATLEKIFADAPDDRTRQAVLSALRSRGGPEAKRVLKTIIERNDIPEKMRMEAISQLASSSHEARTAVSSTDRRLLTTAEAARRGDTGDPEDAAYLRNLYGKTQSQAMKVQIVSAVARMGGPANDQWVMAIAKNRDEDMRLRREALSRLRSTTLTVDDLGKLFDSFSERDLRSAVLQQLARREEPAATDKLIEIAKSGTDPQLRREAISVLARKNDPRTTKLLLELVEKP
jgi:HEAT repeat protein